MTAAGALAAAALAPGAAAAAPATGSPSASVHTTEHAAGNATRHRLVGSRPDWLSNPKVSRVGAVPDTAAASARVWLAPRDPDRLAALARAVSDPASVRYGQHLTHAAYVARFAPTTSQVAAVRSWLTGAGLRITGVGPDDHYLAVAGDVAAAERAFGTSLVRYRRDDDLVRAPATALSVPASLTGRVLAVTGLSPAEAKATPADLGAPAALVTATPCSTYYGQQRATDLPRFRGRTLPYATCGYTPDQLRGAYGLSGTGLTGRGQTVAIVDAFDSSTLESDADTYAHRHGEPGFAPGRFQDVSFPEGDSDASPDPVGDCGGNGWYGEQALDVEAVHAMAPSAGVQYAGAASCYDSDLLASLARVVELDRASVVTDSWGGPSVVTNDPEDGCTPTTPCTEDPTMIAAYESVFEQGAVQGIGFYFSSGDDGDEQADYGVAQPDYPAADPWVTSVGGTALGVDRNDRRLFETGWGNARWTLAADGRSWTLAAPFYAGAGGGYSDLIAEPWYQRGVVRHDPVGGRAVPDIAMDADADTGLLVGETQDFALPSRWGPAGVHYGEYRIGGTSLASPLLAGVQAAVQQGAGRRLGFADPLIYQLARGNGVFYDVTGQEPDPGLARIDYANGYNPDGGLLASVRTLGQDSSLRTGPGWDDVTGVGTVSRSYLTTVTRLAHPRR